MDNQNIIIKMKRIQKLCTTLISDTHNIAIIYVHVTEVFNGPKHYKQCR